MRGWLVAILLLLSCALPNKGAAQYNRNNIATNQPLIPNPYYAILTSRNAPLLLQLVAKALELAVVVTPILLYLYV